MTTRLLIGNVFTELLEGDRGRFNDILSYTVETGRKSWTATYFNKAADTFPTGFLPFVLSRLKSDEIVPEMIDSRVPPCDWNDWACGTEVSWLRPYQSDALKAMVTHGRGIVSMPTGSGKTEVILGWLGGMACDCLVITPGTTLMHQTAERIHRRIGWKVGKVGDGCSDYSAKVIVGTPESVFLNMQEIRLERFGCVIYDEVHGAAIEQAQSVLARCIGAYYRFGFSATALMRTDGRDAPTVGMLGRVIYELSASDAVAQKIIAEPRVEMYRFVSDASPVGSVSMSWSEMHDEMICENADRNRVVAHLAATAEGPILVFVKEVEHIQELLPPLKLNNVRFNYVVGSMSKKQRHAAVEQLTKRVVDVMIATSAFRQAVDIPCIRTLINAGGGESVIDAIQKLGRGTRLSAGKDFVRVIDIADGGCTFCQGGFVHPACKAVATHAARRRYHYVAAGFTVKELVCSP